MKKAWYILLLVAAMTGCGKQAQQAEDAQRDAKTEALDSLFAGLFPADEPGAAVLVMEGDSVVYDKGFGLADLTTHAPIDGNTFFNIASVSKQFTAVAVLQLAEQGRLRLDDAVAQYFPFRHALWKEVRIKHLLSHSSGVPDLRGGIPREEKVRGTDSLAMAYLYDLDHLQFSPGTAYEYINPTFVLCGALVEKVSGQPFTKYVTEHIFRPAGMEHTLYFDPQHQELIPNMAHGYEYADVSNMPEERTAEAMPNDAPKHWYEYDYGEETFFATRPDGGIYTSTHEFAQWEQAWRNNVVLSEHMHALAQTPHTLVSGSPWSDYQNRPNTWYGYGWFIEPPTDSTQAVIYHTGDNGGFKILAARYPAHKGLVLIFANRADWDRYAVKQTVERILWPTEKQTAEQEKR